MSSPLLPDLSATKDVEVAPGLTFRIGYIKPAKLTALRVRLARLPKAADENDEKAKLDLVEPLFDVYRDLCRWGLRGWNLTDPWPTEKEEVRGREVQVAAEAVVEAIEERGWLQDLASAILEFNTLQDDSKKK